MDKLLERQLKKALRSSADNKVDYDILLEMINTTYEEFDKERRLTDRSMELVSKELLELNRKIQEQSEARVQAIMDNVIDGIITCDEQGIIESFNPAAERIFGYSAAEAIGQNIDMLVPELSEDISKYLDTKQGLGREITGQRKDGSTFTMDLAISEMDLDERCVFICVVRDITERKRAEEALHESERRYRLLAENLTDVIWTTDMNLRFTYFSPSVIHQRGYSVEEAMTQTVDKVLTPSSLKVAMKALMEELAIESMEHKDLLRSRTLELELTRKDGSTIWTEIKMTFLRDYDNRPVGVLGVTRDITERKQAEEQLQKAKEAAEIANRAKSEFLANMSHEIRTPLNAIIGMTELTLDTELTPEQRESLKVVESSSEALLGLINNILDFSKIEAGQMQIEEITFNLRELVEGVAEMLSVRAHDKEIELVCYIEPGIPAWVIGDPTRIRQVLVNLASNAIKFTGRGEVSIKVDRAESNDGERAELHFMVSDTGIGISRENQARIFEKFSQVDSSTTRRFGGTGLGLSISKSLVELIGGRMWLESEEGKGSTFHFSFALRYEGKEKEKIEFVYPDFSEVEVLVVDDNSANRMILQKMLSAWGFFKVREAASGIEALEYLRSGDSRVDLVILDHQMPDMDGMELARAIRSEPNLRDTKMIMLSSWGGIKSDVIRELGISESIAKPVKQSKLFDVLMRVLRFSKEEEGVSDTIKPVEISSKRELRIRILLVEDNIDNQNLGRKILENAGYEVEIAENGEIAVEAVRRSQYDLVLMDVQMPRMDGFIATRQIRVWEREQNLYHTPIIALTAHAMEGYRDKCIENEMDDYITKPFKKKVLLETVERWIGTSPRY